MKGTIDWAVGRTQSIIRKDDTVKKGDQKETKKRTVDKFYTRTPF